MLFYHLSARHLTEWESGFCTGFGVSALLFALALLAGCSKAENRASCVKRCHPDRAVYAPSPTVYAPSCYCLAETVDSRIGAPQ